MITGAGPGRADVSRRGLADMSSLVPLLRSLRVEEGLIEIFVREEIDDVVRRLRVPPRPFLPSIG